MWPGLLEKKFDMLDRLVYFMWPDYQERIKKFDTLRQASLIHVA